MARKGPKEEAQMKNLNWALAALGVVSLLGCGSQPQGSIDGATGSLFVDSAPQGASVFVDDVAEGFTPTTVTNLDVGDHTLRLELAGYASYESDVTVEAGANNSPVMAELVPTVTQTGFLEITTDPSSLDGIQVLARVVLNGAETELQTPAMIEVNPTEPHDVAVSLDGFLAVTQENVSCASGATVPVAVPIGADVDGRFRVESNGVIVEVGTSVARGRVEVRLGDADTLVARGNDLFWGDDLSHAGSVAPNHRSFTLTYMGESETYTRL